MHAVRRERSGGERTRASGWSCSQVPCRGVVEDRRMPAGSDVMSMQARRSKKEVQTCSSPATCRPGPSGNTIRDAGPSSAVCATCARPPTSSVPAAAAVLVQSGEQARPRRSQAAHAAVQLHARGLSCIHAIPGRPRGGTRRSGGHA